MKGRSHRARIRWESTLDGMQPPDRRSSEPLLDRWLIGRGAHADLQILDRTVSVEHALLTFTEDKVSVTNVSRRGMLRVNGAALPFGASIEHALPFRLQVGCHIWAVESLESTVPVSRTLPVDDAADRSPTMVMEDHQGKLIAWVGGARLDVRAAALRLLWCLAANAGRVVSHDQLALACARPDADGGNDGAGGDTHQAVKALRFALDALDMEHGLRGAFASIALPTVSGRPESAHALARAEGSLGWMLVRTAAGKGYALALPKSHVHIVRRSLRGVR